MATIVVLGAGLGGIPTAYELRKKLDSGHRVVMVGANQYFEFTPSNPWIAVGWRTRDQTRVDMRRPFENKGVEFIPELADSIDAVQRKLALRGGRVLDYDYLVITTGPKLAFEEVPGLGPDGHTQSICTHDHAERAWFAYEKFLANPGPVVVGAAAGASCFGPAYEFAMIIDADLRKRRLRDKVPMTFVTSEPYIGHMGLGGVGDSKGLMEAELRQRHIKWITNAKVAEATDGKLKVQEMDDEGKLRKEHELAFNYAMILPAFKGVDAVAGVPELCNPRGFVLVDEHQRSRKYPSIFSAGVCIAIPPVEPTPVATGAPKTGFMIESMVSAIAENIVADLAGRPAVAKATWNALCLADFGDSGAAFLAVPQIPPRNVTWAKEGYWVHLAKIAFEKYFLRKVRVGSITPVYEKYVLRLMGLHSLK
jgi:sulfide:quinone oxidoreductase